MNIAIVHFTDIHFTNQTNIENKSGPCLQALRRELLTVDAAYFVLSGDIAFSGNKSEYLLATKFFNKLKQLLEKDIKQFEIKFIIVPGNHDCNFNADTQIRRKSLENLSYDYLGDDNSVIDTCMVVQSEFWDYYKNYNDIPKDKLFYTIEDKIGDYNIGFHCINTSWTSQKNEKPGALFYPFNRYSNFNNEKYFLNIGVWHHPYNWFTPNTVENNKTEFEQFTERIASVHLLGHEHENSFYVAKNQMTGNKINLLSGKVFNDGYKKNVSGFQILWIDVPERKGRLKTFNWNKDFYDSSWIKDVSLYKDSFKKYEIEPEFFSALDEIRIPLTINDRKRVRLSEVFIYPDLDTLNSDKKVLEQYQDSQKILENSYGHSVIAGEDQIGKSSLLSQLFQQFYREGKVPVLITGRDIKELDFDRIIKRAFKKQYQNADVNYEAYLQLDKAKKVLLIDDYHHCKFSANAVYKVLSETMHQFELVLLTIDSAHSLLPVLQSEFKDVGFYKIKPLGYAKRNSLISRYLNLKKTIFGQTDELELIKEHFDKVSNVLGDKLIPSYPIYILSILQALDYNSLRTNETSFGYCYQTLIHYALHKAGVKNDDIGTYFNFLTELAFEFINVNKDSFTESELLTFAANYKEKYIAPPFSKIIKVLLDSRILILDDNETSFGYDYILYYLSAKKIADIIHTDRGKQIIKGLLDKLHIEKNGNILVFVTHHSRDIAFIEDSLIASMSILENYQPITLSLTDPFYNEIKAIASDVSKEIIEINRNPEEERQKQLKRLDDEESAVRHSPESDGEEDFESINNAFLPFKQAFRAIEIIGQIIRNRKGSLEINQLKDLIKEVYDTGFRTIMYGSELLISAKNQIILMVNEDESLQNNKAAIEDSVTDFIMMSSFESCISVFGKIMQSAGLKDLKDLFTEVSNEMKSPAAKLVSFGINSYYGTISDVELKAIVDELKGNNVALKMLRGRVRSYIYSKNLDYKTKQKFAALLDMDIKPIAPKN